MGKVPRWRCGNCGWGMMSLEIDLHCVYCMRRRDALAVEDLDGSESPESSASIKLKSQRRTESPTRMIRSPIEKLHHDPTKDPIRSGSSKSSVSRRQDASSSGRRIDLKIQSEFAAIRIGDLFGQNMLLKSRMVDRSHFKDNLQRLLEHFSVALFKNPQTDLELAISRLLRSRRTRKRVSSRILRYCLIYPGEMVLETPESNSDESEDEDSESYGDSKLVINGIEMNSFIVGSNAFRNVVTGIKLLLLPQNLRPVSRIMMTIPSESVLFSDEEDLSLSAKFEAFAEQISDAKWHWWPLRPRMRLLQKDETRMHWRCHCGRYLWTEMSTSNADLMKDLLAGRGTLNKHDHLCGLERRQKSWNWNTVLDGIRYANPSTSGHQGQQGQYSSSRGSSSSQNSQTNSPGGSSKDKQAQGRFTSRKSQKNQDQIADTTINVQGTMQPVILFGVKGSRITIELAQIDTLKYSRDDLLFRTLKQQYKQRRGRLRFWFSIWKLSHCDFVKFEKIWADAIVYRQKDLPTDTLYDYDPRPPNADNPPISPHEFEVAFASCGDRCSFAPFHECSRVPDRCFALKRIPKRKLQVEMKTDVREDLWGLQAQHAISFLGVLFYHCVILGGPIGFWAWWLVKHPGDLQSAAVPVTISLTLLSLFWSSAGILKGSRGWV